MNSQACTEDRPFGTTALIDQALHQAGFVPCVDSAIDVLLEPTPLPTEWAAVRCDREPFVYVLHAFSLAAQNATPEGLWEHLQERNERAGRGQWHHAEAGELHHLVGGRLAPRHQLSDLLELLHLARSEVVAVQEAIADPHLRDPEITGTKAL